ncbi:TaqI-like C-terminal specificity domain-containing protein [Parabacteroides distasonis]|uniref:TaqI-like C-terminal specificity domain-containing protein n=1 Tax=Parabacteroides distasonis TaxID=823 RepID=UPI0021648855|nr:TaqI-like C-terminal specificity domain-containing protein [Parabacteroides distasonis]UVR95219.1 class I SAM-dependent DNA methyltransferase [Parabacteroides distasonis]
MSDFVQQQSVECRFESFDSWVILSPIEQSIKRKIESVGTPLKDWDIQINYGIKTGFNDAFIISTEKRNEILDNCSSEEERTKTAELIRPILRGRDIKRYGYDWANLWIINTHNGIKGVKPRIDINEYPAVKAHLDQYWDKISKRADKGDTPYNLRNCAYLDDFLQPKLIYPETTQGAFFAYDETGIFLDKTCFMMITKYARYIQATLSSQLFEFAYKRIFSSIELGQHGFQYNKHALIKLPIKRFNEDDSTIFSEEFFYNQYGITKGEIDYIQNAI